MIPIPYEHIFSIYFSLWFLVLLILWTREEWRMRKNSGWSVVKDKLYLCDKCHLAFLARHDQEHVTRCPRCNEMCFIRKRKHL